MNTMAILDVPMTTPTKIKSLSRASSLRSTLPRLVIPRVLPVFTSSPLSAPPLSTPLFTSSFSSPLSAVLPPAPPPSAISPYRHTPVLSRLTPLSPLLPLPPPEPTRFLQVRSLRAERFTVEYLLARFPIAVRIWASTGPGIVAARIEFESVDVAAKVLEQHGGEDAWRMGSYSLEIESKSEGNRWWEWVERRTFTEVKNGEVVEEEEVEEEVEEERVAEEDLMR